MRLWLVDIESLERLSQEHDSRRLVLRMAQLSREGRLGQFLARVTEDAEVDDRTRSAIAELGEDQTFLLGVEEYLARTRVLH